MTSADAHDPASQCGAAASSVALRASAEPRWRPLLELVGPMACLFRWCASATRSDGTREHTYELALTGETVRISAGGQAFGRTGQPVARFDALLALFAGFREQLVARSDGEELSRQLGAALAYAARGEPMPVDGAWLELQARYEATLTAAAFAARAGVTAPQRKPVNEGGLDTSAGAESARKTS